MKVTTKSNKRIFSYSGSLNDEITKAQKEVTKRNASGQLEKLLWAADKAKKELNAYQKRNEILKAFIEAGNKELKRREEETHEAAE